MFITVMKDFSGCGRFSVIDSNISVVIVTASGDIELAVKAIKEGAVDFILKPWDNSRLLATINVAWQLRAFTA